jgi:hypothetical protein
MRALACVLVVAACTSTSAPTDAAPVDAAAEDVPTEPTRVAEIPDTPPPMPADPKDGTTAAIVVARLVSMPEVPLCGVLHVGALLEYEVVDALDGKLSSPRFFAAQSCPWRLAADAPPTFGGFREGDLYRVELSSDPSIASKTMSLWPIDPMPPFYWTVRVDPA